MWYNWSVTKGEKMKNTIKILAIIICLGLSFVGGMVWQRHTDDQIIKDIEEASLEYWESKIIAVKKTCK